MADNEMREVLREQNEHLDRIAKAQWLVYMATQKAMENKTPSITTFGSYGFGGTTAAWRQIVPRNDRRARITFMAQNLSFYFTNDSNNVDINTLINWQNVQFNGQIPVSLLTFSGGVPVEIRTTEAIYVASLTGAGSNVELAGTLNWIEEVYSSISAIPVHMVNESPERPGIIQKLPHSLQELDGDIQGTFTREGVR